MSTSVIWPGGERVEVEDREVPSPAPGELKIRVEAMAEILPRAKRSASIAGRCSVFAKSDMIHAQQRGFKPEEVLKGLCDAVVRNFKGSITKGKEIHLPAALIGGVAANPGVVQAVRSHFDCGTDGDLIGPDLYAWLGAVGAALVAAIGLGLYPDFESVKKAVAVDKSFTPQEANFAVYDRLFESFRDSYSRLRKFYTRLNKQTTGARFSD